MLLQHNETKLWYDIVLMDNAVCVDRQTGDLFYLEDFDCTYICKLINDENSKNVLFFENFKTPNIIHFHGQALNDYTDTIKKIINTHDIKDSYRKEYEKCPFDIISCWTDYEKSILFQQCNAANIPVFNAVPLEDFDKPWYMPNKIKYIISALELSKEDIVLILDGYDVVINTFDRIIDKFKHQPYKILFNASQFRYPDVTVEHLHNRFIYGNYCYLNAGCCIGYRTELLELYKKALAYIDIPNEYISEQFIIRHAFKDYLTRKDQTQVFFEASPDIFVTMGMSKIMTINNSLDILFNDKPISKYKPSRFVLDSISPK